MLKLEEGRESVDSDFMKGALDVAASHSLSRERFLISFGIEAVIV